VSRQGKELIGIYIEKGIKGKYKSYCEAKGISVSDDIRTYILSVLEEPVEEEEILPAEEKNSGKEEIDPRTGFRRSVQFAIDGAIEDPKTEAERRYNDMVLTATK